MRERDIENAPHPTAQALLYLLTLAVDILGHRVGPVGYGAVAPEPDHRVDLHLREDEMVDTYCDLPPG